MNGFAMPVKIREALDYLAKDNLYAYDIEKVGLFAVGLSTVLIRDLPVVSFDAQCPVPASWVQDLIDTCANIRSHLSQLNVSQDHPVRGTLSKIVNHIDWLFSRSYRITEDEIRDARFNDKVYSLLRILNLRDSNSRFIDRYDYRDAEVVARENDEYRQGLLDFVRSHPAEVVTTVYRWAEYGTGRDAEISNDRSKLFELFNTIRREKEVDEKSYLNN